jgi:Arc/MetJ-type ribon-helix-helix transcriptional regulator
MTSTVVSLRLSSEAILAIDGLVGSRGRSEFIRDAVLAALGSTGSEMEHVGSEAVEVEAPKPKLVPATVRVAPKPAVKAKPGGVPVAAKPLVDALRERRMTAREASAVLGWPVMRVEAAAKALGGLVALKAGGVMELVDAAEG